MKIKKFLSPLLLGPVPMESDGAQTICLCGGTLTAFAEGVLVHSLPECRDFKEVDTYEDAADLLRKIRETIFRD